MVIDLGPGPFPGSPIEDLIDFNGTLYFGFDDGVSFGKELWRSDGTIAGTKDSPTSTRVPETRTSCRRSWSATVSTSAVRMKTRWNPPGTDGVELWAAYSDVNPPETTIDSGPGEGETIEIDSATFTFSSNEAGLDLRLRARCRPARGLRQRNRHLHGPDRRSPHVLGHRNRSGALQQRRPDPGRPQLHLRRRPGPATRHRPPTELTGKKQKSPKRMVVKATCVDEACTLKATGRIKVKILQAERQGQEDQEAEAEERRLGARWPARQVRLKLKLNRKAKKLVRRSFRHKASLGASGSGPTDPRAIHFRQAQGEGRQEVGRRKVSSSVSRRSASPSTRPPACGRGWCHRDVEERLLVDREAGIGSKGGSPSRSTDSPPDTRSQKRSSPISKA